MDDILKFERCQEDDYYFILGCDEQSTVEQIVTEYKARVLSCHPDKHPCDDTAAKRFSKLQEAKETLTNPESRSKYDQWRQAKICMPFQQWRNMRDSVHMSMHWGTRKTQPMLDHPDGTSQETMRQKSGDMQTDTGCELVHQAEGQTGMTQPTSGLSFIRRDPDTHQTSHCPWERDPASSLLQKFRNYDI